MKEFVGEKKVGIYINSNPFANTGLVEGVIGLENLIIF